MRHPTKGLIYTALAALAVVALPIEAVGAAALGSDPIKVVVVGDIPVPGTFRVARAAHLSAVLRKAGIRPEDFTYVRATLHDLRAYVTRPDATTRNGRTLMFDLAATFADVPDMTADPLLEDGDTVFVVRQSEKPVLIAPGR